MFNDKKFHYIIVAALATSFSSDALAASRNDSDGASPNGVAEFEATEYAEGAATRARSRGFAETSNLDTKIWNNGLVSLAPSPNTIASALLTTDSSNCCQASQAGLFCREHFANRIDLGNGRTLEVDSIRFDDGAFATTLVGEHSMRPVAINLHEAFPQLENSSVSDIRFAIEPSEENQYRWSYVGRVIDRQSPTEATYVEGDLPMQVRIQNNGEMSVQVDSAALKEALA